MIHGYHLIFGAYGFWLPNDPRGSWSDFVGKWELVRFGKSTKSIERHELTPDEELQRQAAKEALMYPTVKFTGLQARAIGQGFAESVQKGRYALWACAILPEHVHLVVARSRFAVEQIATFLKGSATKELRKQNLDPMAAFAKTGEKSPSPWAERRWKVFLDSEQAIENAIAYVNDNPVKEGKPPQKWNFVTPFTGIDKAGWVTYW